MNNSKPTSPTRKRVKTIGADAFAFPAGHSLALRACINPTFHDAGLWKGERVIECAERTGTDVVVWQDGEIVRLSVAEARAKLTQQQDQPTSDA